MAIFQQLNERDIENCSKVFNDLDEDERSYINHYELKHALERVGVQFNHDNVFYKLISELDDQSGKITFLDFQKIFQK